MTSLQVEGLKAVKRKMLALETRQAELLDEPIQTALVHFYSKISPYPPAPPDSTYQRGIDPRSERLGQQWDYEGGGIKQSLVNSASYSGRVHGRKQPGYHKQTGWRTVEETLQTETPTAMRLLVSGYLRNVRRIR